VGEHFSDMCEALGLPVPPRKEGRKEGKKKEEK
jgi:hypothetical protein